MADGLNNWRSSHPAVSISLRRSARCELFLLDADAGINKPLYRAMIKLRLPTDVAGPKIKDNDGPAGSRNKLIMSAVKRQSTANRSYRTTLQRAAAGILPSCDLFAV